MEVLLRNTHTLWDFLIIKMFSAILMFAYQKLQSPTSTETVNSKVLEHYFIDISILSTLRQ